MTADEIEREASALDELAESVRIGRAELAVRRSRLERARLALKRREWRVALGLHRNPPHPALAHEEKRDA